MQQRIFDSHAHYDDEKFGTVLERENLLEKLHSNGSVSMILNAGAGLESTKESSKLAEKFDFIYFSAGVHPENAHTDGISDGWLETIRNYALHDKCKAIGEIGLDYYYGKDTEKIQKEVFRAQMSLARGLSLPVIIHDREAHADCMEIISEFPEVKGVFHSYSGSFEMAKELFKKGWYISFNGIITFKNARKTVETAEKLTDYENGKYISRVLVETDCPYLSPVPHRGEINNSGNIIHTAKKAAELLDMTSEAFCELTYVNACRLYGLEEQI